MSKAILELFGQKDLDSNLIIEKLKSLLNTTPLESDDVETTLNIALVLLSSNQQFENVSGQHILNYCINSPHRNEVSSAISENCILRFVSLIYSRFDSLEMVSSHCIQGLASLSLFYSKHHTSLTPSLITQIKSLLISFWAYPRLDTSLYHDQILSIINLMVSIPSLFIPFISYYKPVLRWLAALPIQFSDPHYINPSQTHVKRFLTVFFITAKSNENTLQLVLDEIVMFLRDNTLLSPMLTCVLPPVSHKASSVVSNMFDINISLRTLTVILGWPITKQVAEWAALFTNTLRALFVQSHPSKFAYARQNWLLVVEQALKVLPKYLLHPELSTGTLSTLEILLNTFQHAPQPFLACLPIFISMLSLWYSEWKRLKEYLNHKNFNSENQPNKKIQPSNSEVNLPFSLNGCALFASLELTSDFTSALSLITKAKELSPLFIQLTDEASLSSSLVNVKALQSKITKEIETLEGLLLKLSHLLHVQMFCHQGHPEKYIPVQKLLDEIASSFSGINVPPSVLEMETELKAASWTSQQFIFSDTIIDDENTTDGHYPLSNNLFSNKNNNSTSNNMLGQEFAVSRSYSSDSLKSSDQKLSEIAGMVNLGNTCFMNALIQVLYLTDYFKISVMDPGRTRTDTTNSTPDLPQSKILVSSPIPPLLNALQYTFAMFSLSTRSSISPNRLVQALPQEFKGGRQHDSSELQKAIFEELELFWSKIIPKKGSDSFSPSIINPIQWIFGGSSNTTIKCSECGNQSSNSEPFLDMSLTFPESKEDAEEIEIEQLIQYYLRDEPLVGQNQYHCSNCKKLVDATRKNSISVAPRHLIINLVRFRYDYMTQTRSKILTNVVYPEELYLPIEERKQVSGNTETDQTNSGMDVDISNSSIAGYTLYGLIMHSGRSVEHGHYYCYARHSSQLGKWRKFNDDSIDDSTFESFTSISKYLKTDVPYILLYVKNDLELDSKPIEIPAAISSRVQADLENSEKERQTRRSQPTASRQSLYGVQSRFKKDDFSHFGGGGGWVS